MSVSKPLNYSSIINKKLAELDRKIDYARKQTPKEERRSSSNDVTRKMRFSYEPMLNDRGVLRSVEARLGKKWHEMSLEERRRCNEFAKNLKLQKTNNN